MKKKFDVIVIGAGPAGCRAAIELARHKIKVLLLEKYPIPRDKPCAAGLPKHNDEFLDFSIEKVVKCVSNRSLFLFKGKKQVALESQDLRVKMTMRSEFDALLADEAASAGAVIKDSCAATSVTETPTRCEVNAGGDIYYSDYIIGADGPHSVTARSAGLLKDRELGYAINAEVYVSDKQLKTQSNSVVLDMGVQSKGYIWIFPKGDHLSCGIGVNSAKVSNFRERLLAFLDSYPTTRNYSDIILRGHPLPHSYRKEIKVNTQRIFLSGDAASLVEPLSGEGIFYALKSGHIAAEHILTMLKDNTPADNYTDTINREIRIELFYADKFARLFYEFPKLVYNLGVANPVVNGKFLELLENRTSYKDIYEYLKPMYSNKFIRPVVSLAKSIKKVLS